MPNQMIALQARAPRIPTYNELMAGRDQMAARQNALAAQRQQLEQQDYMRQAGGSLDFSDPAAVQEFIARGGPAAAQIVQSNLAVGKNMREQKQAETDAGVKLIGGAFHSVLNDPSDQNIDAVTQRLESSGVPRGLIDQEVTPIRALPVEQRSAAMQQLILQDPNSRQVYMMTQPKPEKFNLNGRLIVRDMNPLSPTYTKTITEDIITMTPAQQYAAENPNLTLKEGEGGLYGVNPKTGLAQPVLVGGPRGGSADVVYGKGDFGLPPKPISQSTIGEVQDFQRNQLIPATRGKVGAGPREGTGAVGTYQITYGTLKDYAPKVLGPNWRNTAFTAEVQDQIARAIYEDVKNGDLKKTWAGLPSNRPGAYANVPWEQARETIAAVESGGGGNRLSGGATGGQLRPEPKSDIKDKSATDSPEIIKARTAAVQALYDAVEDAHDKKHLVANDQSYADNRAQEILQGRTWLPGGTAQKTSLGNIETAASQLMRTFIQKGTSGTLNAQGEQKLFLQGVGGADSTYETRIRTIKNLADQYGIKLRIRPPKSNAGGGKTNAPAKTNAMPSRTKSGAVVDPNF